MYPASVLSLFDHVLALVLAVVFPLRAALFGLRRLRRAPEGERPRVRRRIYAEAMAIQWILALTVLGGWAVLARDLDGLGLVVHTGRGFVAMALAAVVVVVVLATHLVTARRSDATLERVLERVGPIEAMLPHGAADLRGFRWVALTAGVCEELLYRGYLIWYLAHGMSMPWALAIASAIFGLGHLYQGWRGVLTTGALGALLALVYVVSGSLVLGMLVHMAIDLHAGQLAHAAFAWDARRAEAAALARAHEWDAPAEPPVAPAGTAT